MPNMTRNSTALDALAERIIAGHETYLATAQLAQYWAKRGHIGARSDHS